MNRHWGKMKSKSITILAGSFLSVLLFSTTGYAQSRNLIGGWILLSLTENGNDIPLVITENGNNAQLRLTKDSFSITPACNSKSGKYKIVKSGKLKFTPLHTTAMNCGEEALEMDSRFVAVLSKVVTFKIKDQVLTLQDASGQNVLIFNSSSPRNRPKKQKGN